jgi:predicted acetyltransferase
MQSFGGQEMYPSAEEKATHLLYFLVKNHPFSDGNKRSGAYAFVWFLRHAGILNTRTLTPSALTALTILVAQRARDAADPEPYLLTFEQIVRMELVLPATEYKTSYIEAVKEFQADVNSTSRSKWYKSLSIAEIEANFDAFIEQQNSYSRGENIREGYVPYTNYWLVDGGVFIGSVNVRHRLTEELLQSGGHIGYDIRPSQRNKGYGTKILALALPKAKELGITRVLVTCDATNAASRKIIEKNGGALENQVSNSETGVDKLRFWIENV